MNLNFEIVYALEKILIGMQLSTILKSLIWIDMTFKFYCLS